MAPGASRLYMHEIIHIVGAGAQGYMEMTKEWATARAGRGGNRLVGTWASVGATGNWPEVVNLWELTLEDWYGMLDRSYIHREANATAYWPGPTVATFFFLRDTAASPSSTR